MIKKLVGLAAIGGFLYAHKRRGGTLTMDSFKDTARSRSLPRRATRMTPSRSHRSSATTRRATAALATVTAAAT